jgi:hypothetical protein
MQTSLNNVTAFLCFTKFALKKRILPRLHSPKFIESSRNFCSLPIKAAYYPVFKSIPGILSRCGPQICPANLNVLDRQDFLQ